MERDPIHCMVYGDSGGGKSEFASTLPKPLLVLQFDPPDKSGPYLRKGRPQAPAEGEWGPTRNVWHKDKDETIIRIDYFCDPVAPRRVNNQTVNSPTAYPNFLKRMDQVYGEIREGKWASLVIDSVTYMEYASRMYEKFVLNPTAKDPRQWYGGSKDALESILMGSVVMLPCNVVVVAHIDEDRDDVHGNMIYNPAAPGKLSKRMPAGYGELYRQYVKDEEDGKRVYLLQTARSEEYNAGSQIGAPNPCVPHYKALFETK